MITDTCQRWRSRRESYRPAGEPIRILPPREDSSIDRCTTVDGEPMIDVTERAAARFVGWSGDAGWFVRGMRASNLRWICGLDVRRVALTLMWYGAADEWRGVGETLRRTRKGPPRETVVEAMGDAARWALEDLGEPGVCRLSRPAPPAPDLER